MPSFDQRVPLFALLVGLALPLCAQAVVTDSVITASPLSDTAKAVPLLREVSVQASKATAANDGKMQADSASTGTLTKQRLQDVPHSVVASTAQSIKDQQDAYIFDLTRTVPTVTHNVGSYTSAGGSSFSMRGSNSVSNADVLDGMWAYSRVPLEDKERVEILNGVGSFLYGMSPPGGCINYVLKRPTDTTLMSVTAGDYGGSQAYLSGDAGGPLLNGKFGYRGNFLYVNNGETGVSGQTHQRDLASGAVDWNIASNTKLSFDASRFYSDVEHGDDQFALGSKVTVIPDAPAASANYMPAYSSAETWVDRVGTTVSTQVTPFLKLHSNLRYLDKESRRLCATATIIDNAGDLTMSRSDFDQDEVFLQGNAYADATFSTLGIAHTATAGVIGMQHTSEYAYPYSSSYKVSYSGTNNLYNLTDWPADTGNVASRDADVTNERNWFSEALLHDRMDIGSHWSLALGIAYQRIDDLKWTLSSYMANGKTMSPEYKTDVFTPSASLSFKPITALTTYVSYAEGLQQGTTAPTGTANAGETMDPYLSRQLETGAKTRLMGLDLSAALFWISTANAYTDATTKEYVEDGRQVNKGLEFLANGDVGPYVTLGGGFTVLSAEVTRAQADSLENKTAVGVPEQVVKFFGELALPFFPRIFMNGNISYTSKMYVNAMNTLSIPSVVVGDIGMRYLQPIGKHSLTLRAKLTNVANKNYWVYSGSNLYLGNPRTLAFSGTFDL